jgi:hypothetical protein
LLAFTKNNHRYETQSALFASRELVIALQWLVAFELPQ